MVQKLVRTFLGQVRTRVWTNAGRYLAVTLLHATLLSVDGPQCCNLSAAEKRFRGGWRLLSTIIFVRAARRAPAGLLF